MQQASFVDHRGGAREVHGILKMQHNTEGGKGKDVVRRCRPSSKNDGLLHCRPYS